MKNFGWSSYRAASFIADKFHEKRRKGYKKTQGHRQDYYRVRVESIEA